ncbi:uncharacterized protein LOC123538583 isoform X2 [Mercenaria mercenaria]|uniref:uncharacterized protein LOC123538583 isoform X2 n=1 Tax=Mercenaria mercenaria TaxID=6596 RepID=UPI00234F693A|nr:uncharacterized protein LOC123538583 isoform X2 [Mercenaria mercenaria]
MGNKKSSIKIAEEVKDIEVGSKTSTATFLCKLNMSQIEVEWYYCSQRIYPSNKYAIIDDGFIHMLRISDVSENDEGKYSVIAKGLRSEAKLYVLAHDGSKDLKSFKTLGSDSDVAGPKTSLNNPQVWSVDSLQIFNTIRGEEEKLHCIILGCCYLPTGEILLADWRNRRLKKLNDFYETISVCDLPNRHRDVCYCGNNEAVVAMDDMNLQFVDVRGSMSLSRAVKTDHCCRGLACFGNQLYVIDVAFVFLYSIDGIKQRVLYTHRSGNQEFWHIAVSDDGSRIYITDYHTGLHTIDSSGNHLYTFTDQELRGATGVCIDGEGHVLVSGALSENVLQISSDGKQKLGIVANKFDNALHVRTLCFDRRNATLLVAGFEDSIAVVKLK